MNVFDLAAKLTLDSSDYDKGLTSAEKKSSDFGANVKKAFAVGASAVAAMGTAVTTLTTSLVKGVSETAQVGDNIDKASQKMGLSIEGYQEWDAVLQHSGTSIDSLTMGLKTLSTAADKNSSAFGELGIAQDRLAGMSNEDLFNETITALQNMEDANKRAELASELFGKSAMELGPLLNTSAEDTQAMKDRVHELGGVMSEDAVKASAAFQDSLQDMTTAFDGAKRGILTDFMPAITSVMGGLTDMFSGGDGITQINEGISMFVDKLAEATPRIMEFGSQLVLSLSEAILNNLPVLISAAADTVMTIALGLVNQLPTIIETGMDVLLALVDGIIDALPELIPAVVDVILTITEKLTDADMIMELIDAAFRIIGAVAEGIIEALPQIIEKAPIIIANLVEAIVKLGPQLLESGKELIVQLAAGIVNAVTQAAQAIGEIGKTITDAIKEKIDAAKNWGRDLIQNFIDGIKAKWQALKDGVKNVANTVKDFLGFSEPKEGPLSNFHTYAPDMIKLFVKGIKDNTGLLQDAFNDSLAFDKTIDIGVASVSTPAAAPMQMPASAPSEPIIINLVDEIDGVIFARKQFKYLVEEGQRLGTPIVARA